MVVTSYKDLIVWQKSIELVDTIYELTECFPQSQKFSLADQMQRAAVSISSNIAEGSRRNTTPSQCHFFVMAYGSGSELETQLIITKRREFGSSHVLTKAESVLDEVMRMLNKLTKKLQT